MFGFELIRSFAFATGTLALAASAPLLAYMHSTPGEAAVFAARSAQAQEEQDLYQLPRVLVHELTTTVTPPRHIEGVFAVVNQEDAPISDLHYQIQLLSPPPATVPGSIQTDAYREYDRVIREAGLTVLPHQTEYHTFSYEAPRVPEGTYRLRVRLITSQGRELGWADTAMHLGEPDVPFVSLDTGPLVLPDGSTRTPVEGATVPAGQSITAEVLGQAVGQAARIVRPHVAVYRWDITGPQVSEETGAAVTVGTGTPTVVEIPVPVPDTPDAYLALVTMRDENGAQVSNQASFRFVVGGVSAKVVSAHFDQMGHRQGQTVIARAAIVGPADQTTSVEGAAIVELLDGTTVVDSQEVPLTLDVSVQEVAATFTLQQDLSQPGLRITVRDETGTVLDQSDIVGDFSEEELVRLSPAESLAAATSSSVLLAGLLGLVVVAVVVLLVLIIWRRRRPPMAPVMMVLLAAGLMVVGGVFLSGAVPFAHANGIVVRQAVVGNPTHRTGPAVSFWINTPTHDGTYEAGTPIPISGEFSLFACDNGVRFGEAYLSYSGSGGKHETVELPHPVVVQPSPYVQHQTDGCPRGQACNVGKQFVGSLVLGEDFAADSTTLQFRGVYQNETQREQGEVGTEQVQHVWFDVTRSQPDQPPISDDCRDPNETFSIDQNPFAVRSFVNANSDANISPNWDDQGAVNNDPATAQKVCELAGFSRVTATDSNSRWGRGTGFSSCGDNFLSRWTGSAWQRMNACEAGNRWLSTIACADPINACITPTPTTPPPATVTLPDLCAPRQQTIVAGQQAIFTSHLGEGAVWEAPDGIPGGGRGPALVTRYETSGTKTVNVTPPYYPDVNGDGSITDADRLHVVNRLNNEGTVPVATGAAWQNQRAVLDVTGDGTVRPDDVLAVVNHLNRYGSGILSATSCTVTVTPNPADPVGFGPQASFTVPERVLLHDTITAVSTSTAGSCQWQNQENRFDVTNDGSVSAADSLGVRNALATGRRLIPTGPPYPDVTGDGRITREDATAVTNALNTDSQPEAGSGAAWQNQTNRFDVTGDGAVRPVDVVTVLNYLGDASEVVLPTLPPPFVDVTGDGRVSEDDLAAVTSAINQGKPGEAGACHTLSYRWQITRLADNASVTPADATTSTVSIPADMVSRYQFTLTVTDGLGRSSSATKYVQVVPTNEPPPPVQPLALCTPSTQAIVQGQNEAATFSSTIHDATTQWSAPEGNPSSGTGATFSTSYEEASAGTKTVTVSAPVPPYLDVNGDGSVSEVDVQYLVNRSNGVGSAPERTGAPWQNQTDPFDVTGDGRFFPTDVLAVITYVNRYGSDVLPSLQCQVTVTAGPTPEPTETATPPPGGDGPPFDPGDVREVE